MPYEDLTEKIIKAAMTVHNILGFGLTCSPKTDPVVKLV